MVTISQSELEAETVNLLRNWYMDDNYYRLPILAGKMFFKNLNTGCCCYTSDQDIIVEDFSLIDFTGLVFAQFSGIDALVKAGWVLDMEFMFRTEST